MPAARSLRLGGGRRCAPSHVTYASCNVQFAMPALGSGHLTWARVTRHKCHALGELAKPVAEFSSWARACHCHEVQDLDTPDSSVSGKAAEHLN